MRLHFELIFSSDSYPRPLMWKTVTITDNDNQTDILCMMCYLPAQVYSSQRDNRDNRKQLLELIKELRQHTVDSLYITTQSQYKDDQQDSLRCTEAAEFVVKQVCSRLKFITEIHFQNIKISFLLMLELSQAKLQFVNKFTFSQCKIQHRFYNFRPLKFRYLVDLDLSNCLLKESSLKSLINCEMSWLKYFNISNNPIGNKGLKNICQAPWPRLKQLTMYRVRITSHGLKYLSKFQGSNGFYFYSSLKFMPLKTYQTLQMSPFYVSAYRDGNDFDSSNSSCSNVFGYSGDDKIKNTNSIIKREWTIFDNKRYQYLVNLMQGKMIGGRLL